MLQIGARNMQNFELLKEVGRTGMPVLLKRGLSATIDEWLNAAEYIMAAGNSKVALCERGIRTFETATRNTLDLSAVCVLKEKTHLPVIVDPSHATGVRDYVHVVDLADGHVKALEKIKENCGVKIYNLGTGKGSSVLDVVHAYEKACGKKIPYEIKPRRAGDLDELYSQCDKAEKELHWTAKYDLNDMCADSWKWQSMNPNGYND